MAVWRIGRPAQAAILLALAVIYLMMDDAAALGGWAINTPWMLGSQENRPIGTWQGSLDVFPGGSRRLKLRLEPDMLSDADSLTRSEGKNGFFFRRLHTYRGSPYLKGELVVTGATGQTDSYEVEGPVSFRGTQATLNVHGADGRAGVLIEEAVTRFTPPRADLTVRYRVPTGSIQKPAPVFSYTHAGASWTAAIEPAQAHLVRATQ